jgi:hypothetical protein
MDEIQSPGHAMAPERDTQRHELLDDIEYAVTSPTKWMEISR